MSAVHPSGLKLFDRVKHFPTPGSASYGLAFVTGFGMGSSIRTAVIVPGSNIILDRDGVKFHADPTVRELDWREGTWDYDDASLPRFDDLDELTHPAIRKVVEARHKKHQAALDARRKQLAAEEAAREAAKKKAA